MSEDCGHDCGSCSQECAEREGDVNFQEKPNALSHIKKVIGVVSGKGGVGKSLVTSLLAVETQRSGKQAAILDADITGPSIPKMFGITEKARGSELGIFPALTKTGIELMSINLLLEHDSDPVVWRGPIIAGTVKQFWTDVIWNDVDVMFVDMPPGTGDVPLTVFQSLPLDGVVIVASPQELVSMIVGKAVQMANMMKIPIVGVVENMSWLACPDCGKKISIFGDSHVDEIAETYGIPVIGKLPVLPELAAQSDAGNIEDAKAGLLQEAVSAVFAAKREEG